MNKRLWSSIADALAPQAVRLTQSDQFAQQAAVMVLITDEASPQLIFTLRAKHLTYHAGEVCFPGGMWEPEDTTLLHSALRETHEEIGLPPHLVDVLGALPERQTRSGTRVTPFVAYIPADYGFEPNPAELDSLFTVPLEQFMVGLQIRTDIFQHNGKPSQMPVYAYQNYEIWGFTASVTADLLVLLRPLFESVVTGELGYASISQ
jgi:8-oxo-dGTP pyrophosphatase MutT (NUDIX family)